MLQCPKMTLLSFFVTLLVLWIVVILRAQVQSLYLFNEYPKENFSYITLTCYEGRYGSVLKDAQFLLNESNLPDAMQSVESSAPGRMTLVLTQEMEGEFRCASGGDRSEPMQLAGMYVDLVYFARSLLLNRLCLL